MNSLGKTIGAKITQDRYLDKSTLKKLNAKKCEAMFPDKSKGRKKPFAFVGVPMEDNNEHRVVESEASSRTQAFERRKLSVTIAPESIERLEGTEIRSPKLKKT